MILPLAVVGRSPMEEYTQQYPDLVQALKASVADALSLHYELVHLHKQFKNSTDKDDKRHDKHLDVVIREKEERLFRLIKFNDYPALTMAAYPEAQFITGHDYKRLKTPVTDPILIRGITTGDYAKQALAQGRDFYFMETGYLGNYRCDNNQTGRKIYHRIEKNAMQQNRIMDVPDDRWQALCEFNPALAYRGWRKPGSKILLIMSTDKPFEYYGHTRQAWIDSTLATLRQHTDREIVIREKAGRGERTNATIYDALDQDIYAVVTYNSIAAVEAIQYGIPAFSCAPTAASVVSTSDLTRIEDPVKPSEHVIQKWLNSIAYGQFSLTEILTGAAWKLAQQNEQRPTFSY